VSQHELAGAYQANGQVKKAVSLLEQVVKIKEQTLAETHASRLVSQHELAIFYWQVSHHDPLLQMMQRVVEVQRQVFAENHPSREVSENWLKYFEREMVNLKSA
jgi:hypothetical protein